MYSQNKDTVRRVAEEFWNKRNFDLIDELFLPEFHSLGPGPDDSADIKGFQEWAKMLFAAFPDFHVEINDLIAEGDSVAKIYHCRGTFKSDYMGIPPNNKPISISGISVYRLLNGKIKEITWGYDLLGMMQQMGAIPTEAASAA